MELFAFPIFGCFSFPFLPLGSKLRWHGVSIGNISYAFNDKMCMSTLQLKHIMVKFDSDVKKEENTLKIL